MSSVDQRVFAQPKDVSVNELYSTLEMRWCFCEVLVTLFLVPLHVMEWIVFDKTSADLLAI